MLSEETIHDLMSKTMNCDYKQGIAFARAIEGVLQKKGDAAIPFSEWRLNVKAAAERLMGWRLPDDFNPDCFVTFDRERAMKNGSWPTGTNLLSTVQAEEMLKFVFGEQPCSLRAQADAQPFQARVQPWMMACFGAEISADKQERNHRFLEEALELVQACGATASEAHQLVDYVYGRPVGEKHQEIGGVMVTLAALCLAQGEDMHAAGETELARIWTKVDQIRAKQAAKPKHSPLPQHVPAPEAAQALSDEEIRKLAVNYCLFESEGRHYNILRYEIEEDFFNFCRALLTRASAATVAEAACKTCNGSGFIDDGEITGSGGVEYENGPVKCITDCPNCGGKKQAEPMGDEREAAESAYNSPEFNYERGPIGSHDWRFYSAGWRARATRAAQSGQRAGVAEDARDAARYRFIRATTKAVRNDDGSGRTEVTPEEFDAITDAAIAAAPTPAAQGGV
ncbi:hypothetical protein R16034_00858 [Ralstonia edaphis]|uniref:Uncharacterized protein n=1 Tax=Ralstonia edaphi TaxID=3058599 RepID=A0AB72X494_9RALS|nr:hypothetical protein [Ralstonia sp. LMG 6871]CAJ0737816.1 hypothetical protein R16034_00858 [Ralstonia sp. LMG 6871]